MELTREEFDKLRGFIRELCGLIIPDEKQYLITHRLTPLAKSVGCNSWTEFHDKLVSSSGFGLRDQIVSAMTTNETSFFRDSHPFQTFRNHILPHLATQILARKSREVQRKGAKVRLWCAAASTGQEPYTMSMLIHEYCEANKHRGINVADFSLLATDISSRVLAQAMAGEYSKLEVGRGLPREYQKYFTEHDGKFLVDEKLKTIVEYKKLNLTESIQQLGGFDFIACRNVLIYFDDDTKRRILNQFHQILSQGNYLLLGTSEGLYGLTDRFGTEQVGPTILYRKD